MDGDRRVLDAGIGPWVVAPDGSALVRAGEPSMGDWPRQSGSWSRSEVIPLEPTKLHRVVLIGESVARGFLLDPVASLASLCHDDLRRLGVDGEIELVDLAVNNLSPANALVLAQAATELAASAIVLYAGNNFLRSTPWLERDDRAATAAVLRDRGYAAYAAKRAQALADLADGFQQSFDAIVAEARIPLIVVIPAVNLLDWHSPWVVPTWLSAEAVVRWVEHQTALSAIPDDDRSPEADTLRLELATELMRLDHGTTPRPAECAGQAMVRLGRCEEGLDLLDRAVSIGADPANYDRRCPAEVRLALQKLATAPDRRLIDVPARLRERYGQHAFGSDVFLDYCHHTVESLGFVARLVDAEICSVLAVDAADQSEVVPGSEPSIAIGPRELADTYLLSALHNQHWGQSAPTVQHSVERALAADSSTVATLASYYAMSVPDSPFWLVDRLLDPASERWHWFLKNFSHLSVLDGKLAARALRVMAPGDTAEFEAALAVARRDLGVETVEGGVDLLDPFWRERDGPPKPAGAYTGERSPVSSYGFVTSGERPLRLEAVLALGPGLLAGEVEMTVNGSSTHTLEIGPTWTATDCTLAPEELRAGPNELTFRWPAGSRDKECMLDAIIMLGRGPESLDLARLARLRLRVEA